MTSPQVENRRTCDHSRTAAAGGRSGLQDQGFDAALDEVGGGGQADGAGSDDDDGQLVGGGTLFTDSATEIPVVSTFVDGLRCPAWHLYR